MTCERLAKTVLVSLPISVVEALLTIRSALDGDVTSSIAKSLARARPLDTALLGQVPPCFAVNDRGKYAAEFLGIEFAVETLAAVFGRVVDMLADVAPEALVSLAEVRTRGRRFVSLEPSHIHPYSPHLPVLHTRDRGS